MDERARHLSAVLIAFLFGVAALVPVCAFTENLQVQTMHEVRTSSMNAQFLGVPGVIFAAAALLSGLVIWRAGLLAGGISFSWRRIATGTVFAMAIYPVAFLMTAFAVMLLFISASNESHTASRNPLLKMLIGFLTFGLILWFVVSTAVVFLALAFQFSTRFWPRRVLLWAFLLSAAALAGDIIAAILQHLVKFPNIPSMRFVENDPLAVLFGYAWGLPLVVIAGEPLLAALLGQWLYLMAKEYADSST